MSLSFLRSLPSWLSGRRSTTQVGIDLGTRAIKLAGLSREGGSWKREFQMLLPLEANIDQRADAGRLPSFRSQLPLQKGRRKRKSACVSSMGLVLFRQVSLPGGSDEELRGMIEAELQADSEGNATPLFDFWQTSTGERDSNGLGTFSVIAMPLHQAESIAEELMEAGLLCQMHDGLPFALARAVHLANPSASPPIAALDLGASTATWVICDRGQPRYTRILRGCELSKTASALASQLRLSESVGWSVLSELANQGRAGLSSRCDECVRLVLQDIVAETTRTFDYIKNQMPQLTPQSLRLFGVGGTIPLIAKTLAQSLPVPVEPWRLDPHQPDAAHDPLYGAAYAMSAWREQP